MLRNVAIVDVAQCPGVESGDFYLDQVFRICREVLDKAGLSRDDLGTVVSAASDIFHGGVSCANAYYWDSGAALLKNGSRNDGESLTAYLYAAMRVASGHYHTALVLGVCKGSENPEDDLCTHYFSDPFYQRPVGLNETLAAGLQMREYLERSGVTEEQCARVVVKNRANGVRNPYAHLRQRVTLDQVMSSDRVMDPLKELEIAPKSEGIVAILLASEEKAKELTKTPVWFRGFGSTLDTSYLGDRDLLGGRLPAAARQAYRMAGITDPRREIHVAEVSEPYAFQELLWCEQLGFCEAGQGGALVDSGATALDGDLPVNPSGGVLSSNAYASRGLYRLAEVALQLKRQAGEHQAEREMTTGLAHGCNGFAGAFHAVAVVGC